MPIFKWVDPKTGTPNYSDRDLAPQTTPAPQPQKSKAVNPPTAQPGDPGFNWDTYDQWHAGQPDVVGDAKKSLGHADVLGKALGLNTPSYPDAAATRAAHPGAYDDLTDQQLSLALGKQKAALSAPDTLGAIGRFGSGVLSTSPLNPMNLVRAAAHPVDTVSHLVGDPLSELFQAGKSGLETVTGGDENGRMISGLETLKHMGGAVPLIGKAATDAGTHIGEGNVATGLGELAGLGSAALLPKVPAGVDMAGRATSAVGRGLERGGQVAIDFKHGGGFPALGALEAVMHSGPKGAAIAAAPYAVKYGGRGMQSMGGAMQGLAEVLGHGAPEPAMTPRPMPPAEPISRPAPSVPDPFGGRRTNPVSAGSPGGLSDVAAGKVRPPDSYISDITAGDPNVPGLSIGGPLEKPTPMSQVPFSRAKQSQRQGAAFQKFTGEGDLTPDEMGQKVAALNESSPWPPKPGQEGFGMQRTPARGSFTSQDSLLDLVNSKYPQLKVTSLKDFPMPGGNDPLSKAIRQRGHAFGGK